MSTERARVVAAFNKTETSSQTGTSEQSKQADKLKNKQNAMTQKTEIELNDKKTDLDFLKEDEYAVLTIDTEVVMANRNLNYELYSALVNYRAFNRVFVQDPGQYQKHIKILQLSYQQTKKLADANHPHAQFLLAWNILDEDFGPIVDNANWMNDKKKYMELACNNGIRTAGFHIGMWYLNGLYNYPINAVEAFRYLTVAANLESSKKGTFNSKARVILAQRCYWQGNGTKASRDKAFEIAKDLVENHKDLYAYPLYAKLLLQQTETRKPDIEKAKKIIDEGISLGSNDCKIMYAACYLIDTKNPSEEQKVKAFKFLQEMMPTNNSHAQYIMALCYKNGIMVPLSPERAAEFFIKAADQDFHPASFEAGLCLLNGIGVQRNPIAACKYFKNVAEEGHVQSKYYYGQCLLLGNGCKADPRAAINWLAQAIEGANNIKENDNESKKVIETITIKSLYHLGIAYQKIGQTAKAIECLQKGIKDWSDEACKHELASLYLREPCRLINPGKSSETVNATEQMTTHSLAIRYLNELTTSLQNKELLAKVYLTFYNCHKLGIGVEHNKTGLEPIEFLSKAAELGNVQAYLELEKFYLVDKKDIHESFKWLGKAAKAGHEQSMHLWCGTVIANPKIAAEIQAIETKNDTDEKNNGDTKNPQEAKETNLDRALNYIQTLKKIPDGNGHNLEAICLLKELIKVSKESNASIAVARFKEAMDLGSLEAINNYGLCLVFGIGLKSPDIKKGIELIQYAKNIKGSFEAQFNLALLRLLGYETEAKGQKDNVAKKPMTIVQAEKNLDNKEQDEFDNDNEKIAKAEFKQAEEDLREFLAKHNMVIEYKTCFGFGYGEWQIDDLGLENILRKNPDFYSQFGRCYLEGLGTIKNTKKAIEIFKELAPNNIKAKIQLIKCYINKMSQDLKPEDIWQEMRALLQTIDTSKKNIKKVYYPIAINLLQQLTTDIEIGLDATTELGIRYWEGRGVPKDELKTHELFKQYVDDYHKSSDKPVVNPKDNKEESESVKARIQRPNSTIYRYLALCNYQGIGSEIKVDLDKTLEYLEQALLQEDNEALVFLEKILKNNLSENQQIKIIEILKQLLCSQNQLIKTEAAMQLAYCFSNGELKSRDQKISAEIFAVLNAAATAYLNTDKENPKIYKALARCYEAGIGTNEETPYGANFGSYFLSNSEKALAYHEKAAKTDKESAFLVGGYRLMRRSLGFVTETELKNDYDLLYQDCEEPTLKSEIQNALAVCSIMGWDGGKSSFKDKELVFNKFKDIARQEPINDNSVIAMHNLGWCQLLGIGIKKPDPIAAKQSFELAKNAGSIEAQYALAFCYLMEAESEEAWNVAVKMFQEADLLANKSKNSRSAQYNKGLGLKFARHWTVNTLLEKFLKNNPKGLFRLGLCYLNGLGFDRDNEKAYAIFESLFDSTSKLKEDSKSNAPLLLMNGSDKLNLKISLANCHLNGLGTPKNIEAAHAIFSDILKEILTPKFTLDSLRSFDPNIISSCLHSIEEQGFMPVLVLYANCYLNCGSKVLDFKWRASDYYNNQSFAVKLLDRITCTYNNSQAKFLLAKCIELGICVEKKPVLAARLYQELANNNDGPAISSLASLYKQQLLTTENAQMLPIHKPREVILENKQLLEGTHQPNNSSHLQTAFELYKKGAKLEDPRCTHSLGTFFEQGIGGAKQDLKQAFEYYLKAYNTTTEYDPDFAYSLARCYALGQGVEQDLDLAEEIYLVALEYAKDPSQREIHTKTEKDLNRVRKLKESKAKTLIR